MTRLALIPPTHCSACFGQYPDRTHVDFEASYDGPVIEGGVMGENGEVANRIPVTIDELMLCEDCLRDGARLIGMVEEDADRVSELTSRSQEQAERIAGLQAYVDQLEKTIAAKPEPAKRQPQRKAKA